MTSRKIGLLVLAVVGCVATIAIAYPPEEKAAKQQNREKKEVSGKEMTFVGKLVDMQSYMTGQFASDDHAKATADAIKAGVPAAIETPSGLIIIGQGASGPSQTLVPLALQRVQVNGKLYEKKGVKYIDITAVRAAAASSPDEPPAEE